MHTRLRLETLERRDVPALLDPTGALATFREAGLVELSPEASAFVDWAGAFDDGAWVGLLGDEHTAPLVEAADGLQAGMDEIHAAPAPDWPDWALATGRTLRGGQFSLRVALAEFLSRKANEVAGLLEASNAAKQAAEQALLGTDAAAKDAALLNLADAAARVREAAMFASDIADIRNKPADEFLPALQAFVARMDLYLHDSIQTADAASVTAAAARFRAVPPSELRPLVLDAARLQATASRAQYDANELARFLRQFQFIVEE